MRCLKLWLFSLILSSIALPGQAAAQHRPPAVPLITNDPYFSIWSMADQLTAATTKHWSEAPQPMTGLIRIDGRAYRWMGEQPRWSADLPDVPAMHQNSLQITPLHTRYQLSAEGVELQVTFFTPLFPDDLDVLSRPVTYLSWSARSTDGASHQLDLLLDISPQIAVNENGQRVTWGRSRVEGMGVLNIGSQEQANLHQSGDRIRIDWGHFHLCVPDTQRATAEISSQAVSQFLGDGKLADIDDLDMPRAAGSSRRSAAHLAVELRLGSVGAAPAERHVLLAYTQGDAIEYLGRRLRQYWQRDGMTPSDMLATAEREYLQLEQRGRSFDSELMKDMKAVGGPDYEYLTSLVFRQTIAAHELVADVDGTPMLFSKEKRQQWLHRYSRRDVPVVAFFPTFQPKVAAGAIGAAYAICGFAQMEVSFCSSRPWYVSPREWSGVWRR